MLRNQHSFKIASDWRKQTKFAKLGNMHYETQVKPDSIPPQAMRWLQATDSLTARLRRYTDNAITPVCHFAGWGHTLPEEAQLLGLTSNDPVWIRELDWVFQQECWVCARTVVPAQTMRVYGSTIQDLNENRVLGDFMFAEAQCVRSHLELFHPDSDHPLYLRAKKADKHFQAPLFSRRSIFMVNQLPIVVSEAFLSALLQQPFQE